MIHSIEEIGITNKINKILCVADNDDIETIFYGLGYLDVNTPIYIDEEKISNTNFKNSKFMYKDL